MHANLNWTLGPLKYVLVSPVFHRWHHAMRCARQEFRQHLSLWDLMFGTFYMPEGALPEAYGIDDENMPEGLVPQLVYPLLQVRAEPDYRDKAPLKLDYGRGASWPRPDARRSGRLAASNTPCCRPAAAVASQWLAVQL